MMPAKVQGGRARLIFACVGAVGLSSAPARGAEAFITDQTGDAVSVLDLSSKHVVARDTRIG
jgi:hypothetical protein